jgi:HEAT repeat protein
MKSYLIVVFVSGALYSGWAFGKWMGRAGPEASYRGESLTHWARVLTADQSRQTHVLLEIGPRIVPHLEHEMTQCQSDRAESCYAIYSMVFTHAPGAIRSFLPAPISPEERRLNAIILLGKLGPAAEKAVPALIGQLGDETLEATGAVVLALKRIGPAAKDAVPKLIELLDEPSAEVAAALGEIGPEASAAIPALIRVSTNGPLTLRRSAQAALQRIAPNQFAHLR